MLKIIFSKLKTIRKNKKEVKIGKNTRILTNWLNFGSEPYLIEIGDNCIITSGVKFVTHDASISVLFNYLKEERQVGNIQSTKMGRIKIENNCMVGINSIILQGVTIGTNSIIGAGSVVTKDVPPNTVVAGNPAKVIMSLEEYINKTKPCLIKISKPNEKEEIKRKVKKNESNKK